MRSRAGESFISSRRDSHQSRQWMWSLGIARLWRNVSLPKGAKTWGMCGREELNKVRIVCSSRLGNVLLVLYIALVVSQNYWS